VNGLLIRTPRFPAHRFKSSVYQQELRNRSAQAATQQCIQKGKAVSQPTARSNLYTHGGLLGYSRGGAPPVIAEEGAIDQAGRNSAKRFGAHSGLAVELQGCRDAREGLGKFHATVAGLP